MEGVSRQRLTSVRFARRESVHCAGAGKSTLGNILLTEPVTLTALRTGLGDRIDESVNNLSGRERQRVALGLLTVSPPKALILDEPTSALDIPARRAVHHAAVEALRNSVDCSQSRQMAAPGLGDSAEASLHVRDHLPVFDAPFRKRLQVRIRHDRCGPPVGCRSQSQTSFREAVGILPSGFDLIQLAMNGPEVEAANVPMGLLGFLGQVDDIGQQSLKNAGRF